MGGHCEATSPGCPAQQRRRRQHRQRCWQSRRWRCWQARKSPATSSAAPTLVTPGAPGMPFSVAPSVITPDTPLTAATSSTGMASPYPTGVSSPNPTGVTWPDPSGVASPDPTGVATPVLERRQSPDAKSSAKRVSPSPICMPAVCTTKSETASPTAPLECTGIKASSTTIGAVTSGGLVTVTSGGFVDSAETVLSTTIGAVTSGGLVTSDDSRISTFSVKTTWPLEAGDATDVLGRPVRIPSCESSPSV